MNNQYFQYKKNAKWEGIIFLLSWLVLIIALLIKNIAFISVLLVSFMLIVFGPILIFTLTDTLIYKVEVNLYAITIWKKFAKPLKINSSTIRKVVLDESNSIMSIFSKNKIYKINTSKLDNVILFLHAIENNANKNNFNITHLGFLEKLSKV